MLEADSGFNAATKVFELKVVFAGAVPGHLNLRFVLKTQPSIHPTKSITKLPSNVVSIIFCFPRRLRSSRPQYIWSSIKNLRRSLKSQFKYVST